MQCSEIRDLLSGYIDEVLDRQEKTAVAEHLRTCSSCVQELADLQATVRLLHSLGEVAPPAEFSKQLREKLAGEPAPGAADRAPEERIKGAGWAVRIGRRFSGSWKYAAAAVIIIGLGVSIGVYSLVQMNPGSPVSDIARNYRLNLTDKAQQDLQVPADKGTDSLRNFSREHALTSEEAKDSLGSSGTPADEGKLKGTTVLETGRITSSVQKIIKDGYLNLEVNNCREFGVKLATLVEHYGGFIEKSSENDGETVTTSFVIRVPAKQFAELVSRLEALGKVTGKQITGRDATGEYIDAESRLHSLQRQEQRLLSLVDKAKSLSEVLALENELSRIRGEIEALQGQLKHLEDAAVFSTLRIEAREVAKPQVEMPRGVFGRAWQNLQESIVGMLHFFGGLVAFTGWVLPWAVLIGIIAAAVFKIRKQKKRGEQEKN